MYIMRKSSFLHVVRNFIVVFYFSHDCFVFPFTLLSFIQLLRLIILSPTLQYNIIEYRPTSLVYFRHYRPIKYHTFGHCGVIFLKHIIASRCRPYMAYTRTHYNNIFTQYTITVLPDLRYGSGKMEYVLN